MKENMKAYELTEAQIEGHSEISTLASKAGYSSLRSYLNEHNRWSDDVSEIEGDLKIMETTRNDTINFRARRLAAIADGRIFEVEIGDCNASEFAWSRTEAEARAAHAELLEMWEIIEDEVGDGYIEHNSIHKILVDDDGDEIGTENIL